MRTGWRCTLAGTAEAHGRCQRLILHGTEATSLHTRTKLHLQLVLVSRVITGSSPLNLLVVFLLKKKIFYTDKTDFSLPPPLKDMFEYSKYITMFKRKYHLNY